MTNPGGIEHENKPSSLPGARPKVAIHGSRAPESGWPLPLLTLICWPDRGKTPCKGVETAIFWGIGYVDHNGATPVARYG